MEFIRLYMTIFKRKITQKEYNHFKRILPLNSPPMIIKNFFKTLKHKENREKKKLWDQKMKALEKRYELVTFDGLSRDSPNVMVIVEPRQHPHLEAVLKNMVSQLPQWSLHIFHGKDNEQFVHNILGDKHNVKLTNLNVANLTGRDYARLCASQWFLKRIEGNKFLKFEVDTLIRHNNIHKFLSYDYIGAPWDKFNPAIKITGSAVGNGGFSLRTCDKCLHLAQKYPYRGEPEDVYFSKYMNEENFNIAPPQIALEFAVDQVMSENPLAIHKIYNNPSLRISDIKKLLDF